MVDPDVPVMLTGSGGGGGTCVHMVCVPGPCGVPKSVVASWIGWFTVGGVTGGVLVGGRISAPPGVVAYQEKEKLPVHAG